MTSSDQPAPLVVLSFKKHLVAMNVSTGERAWTHALEDKNTYGALRVEHGHVFFITAQEILCLNYLTGKRLWTSELPGAFSSSPRIITYNNCLVLLNIGEAACFAMNDGALRWHDKFRGMGIHGGAMAAPGVWTDIDRIV